MNHSDRSLEEGESKRRKASASEQEADLLNVLFASVHQASRQLTRKGKKSGA
jgi:hypothetical protein